MAEAALRARLAHARTSVKRARDLLAHPRSCRLDDCIRLLVAAQNSLESVFEEVAGGEAYSSECLAETQQLQREVRQAGVLLEHAARFGRMWLQRLQSAAGGYTIAGSPAPVAGSAYVSAVA